MLLKSKRFKRLISRIDEIDREIPFRIVRKEGKTVLIPTRPRFKNRPGKDHLLSRNREKAAFFISTPIPVARLIKTYVRAT